MGGGIGRVTHHPEFYLEDGSVSFLTAGVLFRVHKTFFQRESEVFRDLFESATNDTPPSGTDACPFTLDVTPDEFAKFLWIWYDRDYAYRQQTKENWLTILHLAARWHFDKVKELALREIEFLELPPAERISIYDNHGIDGERLISSCVELCKSPSVPTHEEARSMRMDTLIKILQAREDAQRKAVEMGHESPTSACLEDKVLKEIVSEHFKKSLGLQSSGSESTGLGDQASGLNTDRKTSMPTITVGKPQVPDKKGQTANQPPPHLTNGHQADGDGKGNQEKKQGEQAKDDNMRKPVDKVVEGMDEEPLQVTQDKKAEKEKEKEKEKEEAQKAEEARQDKAKAAQKQTGNHRNKPRGH